MATASGVMVHYSDYIYSASLDPPFPASLRLSSSVSFKSWAIRSYSALSKTSAFLAYHPSLSDIFS